MSANINDKLMIGNPTGRIASPTKGSCPKTPERRLLAEPRPNIQSAIYGQQKGPVHTHLPSSLSDVRWPKCMKHDSGPYDISTTAGIVLQYTQRRH